MNQNTQIELSARGGGGKGGPGMKEAGLKTPKNTLGNFKSLKRGLKQGNWRKRIGKKHKKIIQDAVSGDE